MQSTVQSEIICQCPCGAAKLTLQQLPITRFFCHCTICQAVYRQPHSDETILWASDVTIDEPKPIAFQRYRRPPAASRGICQECKSPVVAFVSITPLMRLAIVPSHLYIAQADLPTSRGHIFYGARTSDVDDQLPKHVGYLSSQFAALRHIVTGVAAQAHRKHCGARNSGAPAA